jgi:hypothetical protein
MSNPQPFRRTVPPASALLFVAFVSFCSKIPPRLPPSALRFRSSLPQLSTSQGNPQPFHAAPLRSLCSFAASPSSALRSLSSVLRLPDSP